MKVKILVDGIYNDPRHRAQSAKVGDVIDVAGGNYALSLIQDGFAERVTEAPAELAPAEPPATTPAKAPPKRGKKQEAA